MPRIHAITTIEILACTLPIFLSSINQATDGSKREIAELHAAIETSIKNIAPTNNPADMFPKAIGKLINIKPGPAVGSSPAVEKTIENVFMILYAIRDEKRINPYTPNYKAFTRKKLGFIKVF